MKPITLIISCEHAVNYVPLTYLGLFEHQKTILDTHRAIDFGSLDIATQLSQRFQCEFTKATVTRLLVDCNRSASHAQFFSEFTQNLPALEKQKLIDDYYFPYRQQIMTSIEQHIKNGYQVLHLSIHSFTPELNGIIRNAAIGLLYDPKRHAEREVARVWRGLLLAQAAAYNVRLNYPYRGISDGFTSSLRKKFPEKDYLGIEVESNQAITQDSEALVELIQALSDSLQELLLVI